MSEAGDLLLNELRTREDKMLACHPDTKPFTGIESLIALSINATEFGRHNAAEELAAYKKVADAVRRNMRTISENYPLLANALEELDKVLTK